MYLIGSWCVFWNNRLFITELCNAIFWIKGNVYSKQWKLTGPVTSLPGCCIAVLLRPNESSDGLVPILDYVYSSDPAYCVLNLSCSIAWRHHTLITIELANLWEGSVADGFCLSAWTKWVFDFFIFMLSVRVGCLLVEPYLRYCSFKLSSGTFLNELVSCYKWYCSIWYHYTLIFLA